MLLKASVRLQHCIQTTEMWRSSPKKSWVLYQHTNTGNRSSSSSSSRKPRKISIHFSHSRVPIPMRPNAPSNRDRAEARHYVHFTARTISFKISTNTHTPCSLLGLAGARSAHKDVCFKCFGNICQNVYVYVAVRRWCDMLWFECAAQCYERRDVDGDVFVLYFHSFYWTTQSRARSTWEVRAADCVCCFVQAHTHTHTWGILFCCHPAIAVKKCSFIQFGWTSEK